MMDSYQRFPNDAEFENEIIAKDVYSLRSRNYLLSKLENYERKEPVIVDEYTIEHILPQNSNLSAEWRTMLGENWKEVQEKYLHTLGNLTLTGYNSELSDRPFIEKKTIKGGFNDSPIRLNDCLRSIDAWNEEQILNRAIQLAEKARKVWRAPKLSAEVLAKYQKSETKETSVYTIDDHEFLKNEMLDLFNTLRKRILNIDSSVREEFKKLYIAYKSSTNFVDIVPQKSKLRLSLNIDFEQIHDPYGLSKDVSGKGRWGNGDVEVNIHNTADLDKVMDLIQQAFDAQTENI
jgi:predicted transport protein